MSVVEYVERTAPGAVATVMVGKVKDVRDPAETKLGREGRVGRVTEGKDG